MEHSSFHHRLSSRELAERELKEHCPHDRRCYLTWWSESRQTYKLSVSTGGREFHHFNIVTDGKGSDAMYEIQGCFARYNDAATMLNFYKDCPVGDISGIGECYKPYKKSKSVPNESASKSQIKKKTISLDYGRQQSRDDLVSDTKNWPHGHYCCLPTLSEYVQSSKTSGR